MESVDEAFKLLLIFDITLFLQLLICFDHLEQNLEQ